jgi:hypothetical protein
MRRRHLALKDRILAILERVAELWANAFILFVVAPALDPKRLRTREDVEIVERHLYSADAHITRAIYRTARRLAGLPRVVCPVENFYRPSLKSPRHIRWLYLNCVMKLTHARRLAIRMAWRWRQEDERRKRDPLCDLRSDIGPSACLPLLRSNWGRWLAASSRPDGGGSPAGILGSHAGQRIRAPP